MEDEIEGCKLCSQDIEEGGCVLSIPISLHTRISKTRPRLSLGSKFASCPSCIVPFHIRCLSISLLSRKSDLVPTEGNCPACSSHILWADIVSQARLSSYHHKSDELVIHSKMEDLTVVIAQSGKDASERETHTSDDDDANFAVSNSNALMTAPEVINLVSSSDDELDIPLLQRISKKNPMRISKE